jgi:hypothetical protein
MKTYQAKILEALSSIQTDVDLYLEGRWEPNDDSMEAIGDMVTALHYLLVELGALPMEATLYDVLNEPNPLETNS